MRDVEIAVDMMGMGSTVVGGVDISARVIGIKVYIEPGYPTRVEIEVAGDVVLDAKQADVTMSRQA